MTERLLFVIAVLPLSLPLASQSYFPPSVLAENAIEDTSNAEWYSKTLRALKEPSLWEIAKSNPQAEVYRFTYIRSFHDPISVRIVLQPETQVMVIKQARRTHGENTGRLVTNRTAKLPTDVAEALKLAVTQDMLWDLPAFIPRPEDTVQLDGSQWIVELVQNGRYHVLNRWSPDLPDEVRRIGELFMFGFAHLRLLYTEVY